MNEIRFIDLFGGVGGFRLGLERDNSDKGGREQSREEWECEQGYVHDKSEHPTFRCVAYYDSDKYAVHTYNKNFKETHEPTDITLVKSEDIPDHDLLCAGFPCQSFSIAGKGGGFEDTRGTMFFEVARILRDKRPEMVLLENVKGLLSHDQGRTFGTILNTLAELGYVGQYEVLNSKNFGVPQNRERVFIFGVRGKRAPQVFPLGEAGKQPDVGNTEVATSLQHPGHSGGNYRGMTMIHQLNNPVHSGNRVYGSGGTLESRTYSAAMDLKIVQPCLTPDRPEKRQHGRRFKENGEPMFTLTGQDVHELSTGSQIRRLTPIECERLQGFPDGWTQGVSDTQRYKQMGNAVTVNVIQVIGERILEAKK